MPKVSVIIPVYNVEKYLKESLDSLVKQTLQDIEIICIDDGSTDSSGDILKEYAKNDNRITIITQENKGQGDARNKGIEIAKGEYLAFLDPDDWFELNALETLYDFAKLNAAQIVKFPIYFYSEYYKKVKKGNFIKLLKETYGWNLQETPYYTYKTIKDGCLYKLGLAAWDKIYKTEFIKSNNIKFAPGKFGEDNLFTNSSLLLADKILYLDKYLYYYRIREGSSANKLSGDWTYIFDNVELMRKFLIEHELYEELKDEFIKYAQNFLLWGISKIKKSDVKAYKKKFEKYFSDSKELELFMRKNGCFNCKPFEKIFSVKNDNLAGIKVKVITIFGFEFRIKIKNPKFMPF